MAIDINSIKYIPDLPGAHTLEAADLLHLNQKSVDTSVSLSELAKFMANIMYPIGSLMFFGDKGKDPNAMPEYQHQTWVKFGVGYTLRGGDDTNLGTTAGGDQVSILAANIPQHDHGLSAGNAVLSQNGAHSHTLSVGAAGSHNHAVGSGPRANDAGSHTHGTVVSATDNHQHEYLGDDMLRLGGAQVSRQGGAYDAHSDQKHWANWYWTSPAGGHTHTVTVQAGGVHAHNVSIPADGQHTHSATLGQAPNHTHTISGKTDTYGSGQKLSVLNATTYVAVWKRTA